MQRIEAEGDVNIYEFLEELRMQRIAMVQNEVLLNCTLNDEVYSRRIFLKLVINTYLTSSSMCSFMMPCVSISFVETLRLLSKM